MMRQLLGHVGVRHAVVAVVVGLFINVGTIWSTARPWPDPWLAGVPRLQIHTFQSSAAWSVRDQSGDVLMFRSEPVSKGQQFTWWPARLRYETYVASIDLPDGGEQRYDFRRWSYGWPWPALRRQLCVGEEYGPRPVFKDAPEEVVLREYSRRPRVRTEAELGTLAVRGTQFPIHPIWPGLIGNTLVFGAALLPFPILPGFIIRLRRARRGLCVACGYDLASLSRCPECGAGVERPAAVVRTG